MQPSVTHYALVFEVCKEAAALRGVHVSYEWTHQRCLETLTQPKNASAYNSKGFGALNLSVKQVERGQTHQEWSHWCSQCRLSTKAAWQLRRSLNGGKTGVSKRCSGACAFFHAKLFEPHFPASLDGAVGLATGYYKRDTSYQMEFRRIHEIQLKVLLVGPPVCSLRKAPYL